MKRKIGLAIGGVVAAGLLAFGVFYSDGSKGTAILSADEISSKVTSEYPGEITVIKKETDSNHAYYEVELSNEGKIYGLTVDGSSGVVLDIREKITKSSLEIAENDVSEEERELEGLSITEKESEKQTPINKENDQYSKDDKDQKEDNNQSDKNHHRHKGHHADKREQKHSSMHTVISVEEAKQIALKEFPGEVDDVDLERENGRLVYEIEIERGDQEAEIIIDAYTGEVIMIEIDED